MPDLAQPTSVERRATWQVDGTQYRVIRGLPEGQIWVNNQHGTVLSASGEDAARLAPVIAAAAAWTGDQVVDAEVIDERPRYTYELIRAALAATRPRWMTREAADELARGVLRFLVDSTELDGVDQ